MLPRSEAECDQLSRTTTALLKRVTYKIFSTTVIQSILNYNVTRMPHSVSAQFEVSSLFIIYSLFLSYTSVTVDISILFF